MSVFSPTQRIRVTERAGHRCEYCHLPVRGQVATFPIDHVIPRHAGGGMELENLALACPHCNAHKWKHAEARDELTKETVALFHPHKDYWDEHFEWQWDSAMLHGKTATGRATVAALQINAPSMVELRLLLRDLSLFSP